MSTAIWLCLALPVMATLLVVYFTAKKKPLRLAAKGCTTGIALATAIFCHLQGGNLPSGRFIIAALALFVLADVLLDLKFFYGVTAFAAGHIALISWLSAQESALHQSLFILPGFSIAAVLYVLAVSIFRKTLFRSGSKAIVMLLYAAVLALMTGVSLTLPHFGGIRHLPFALGACLFMASDLLVARSILTGVSCKWRMLPMVIYESAVMLMALSA